MKQTIERVPFVAHLQELQKRLVYIALALGVGGAVGYVFQHQLVHLIIRPLGTKLYYSNPAGGFSFLFNVCLLAAILLAIPVIVYNVMRFMLPAMPARARFSMPLYLFNSICLAAAGVVFAYVWSLPAALHFLSSFGSTQVQPMLFVGDYLRFVITYLISFAILFQVPIIIGIIDKITPLKPGKMMKFERYIILGSFILAAAITPTPDPLNQAIMAAPIVLLYQFSVVYVWLKHRRRQISPVLQPVQTSMPQALQVAHEAVRSAGQQVVMPVKSLHAPTSRLPQPNQPVSIDGVMRRPASLALQPVPQPARPMAPRPTMAARIINDVAPMHRQQATA